MLPHSQNERHMLNRIILLFLTSFCLVQNIDSQSANINIKLGTNSSINLDQGLTKSQLSNLFASRNGHHASIEIEKNFSIIGLKAGAAYLSSNSTIAYDAMQENAFYGHSDKVSRLYSEIIDVNKTAFNLYAAAQINLGPVSFAAGPELSLIAKAVGKGSRILGPEDIQNVQYNFYSKRKQVFNRENDEEKQAFQANRLLRGWNFHTMINVFDPFSIEIKTFLPTTQLISSFTSKDVENLQQREANVQLAIVYTLPVTFDKKYTKRKKRAKNPRERRFSSVRHKRVNPRARNKMR